MVHERSIELKVGIVILTAVAIVATFVLVMGGLSFQRTYAVYVDFDNPGGLHTGSAVRMAGVRIGSVTDLSFRGGVLDQQTGRRTLVRATVAIESRAREAIHKDADFYVTTQGVLGEQFLAVEPGSSGLPALEAGTVVKGIDPPRLDLFLAKAYELLDTTVSALRNNKELIQEMAASGSNLIRGLSGIVNDNRQVIDGTITNINHLSSEATQLTREARAKYVANPKIDRAIDNVDTLTTTLRNSATPLIDDAKATMANARRVSEAFGDDQQQAKIRAAVTELISLITKANGAVGDAQSIVARLKKGDGTVGALLMDEQIYDDVQEMVRDLKHNPWKFLWRE